MIGLLQRIAFAKTKSEASAKADGTWVEGEKEAKKRKESAQGS
jgi:hypothetical protein